MTTPVPDLASAFKAARDVSTGAVTGVASFLTGSTRWDGPVTCLYVGGNRAVLGVDSNQIGRDWYLVVVDGGAEGFGRDTFDAVAVREPGSAGTPSRCADTNEARTGSP